MIVKLAYNNTCPRLPRNNDNNNNNNDDDDDDKNSIAQKLNKI